MSILDAVSNEGVKSAKTASVYGQRYFIRCTGVALAPMFVLITYPYNVMMMMIIIITTLFYRG